MDCHLDSSFFLFCPALWQLDCILGASPFAVLGFITYNGLTAEQFIWAWIKSELLIPREIKFESNNVYWEAFIPYIANKEREELKRDKNVK